MTGIETIIEAEGWRRAMPDAEAFAAKVYDAARREERRLAGPVALLLADDATLKDLNSRFRGKDKPTNVLSFPSGVKESLGDIALALETCEREAFEKSIPFTAHAAHLIAHGLLHLAGYDHEKDADAVSMEAMETKILASLGLPNPYAETIPCTEECAG